MMCKAYPFQRIVVHM